jgi:hypothetical protein
MVDYYEELLKEIRKGKPSPKLMEYFKANVTKRFCPHMFFQDLDKDQENVHCKIGTPADCYKCWFGKAAPKPPKPKKEKKKKIEPKQKDTVKTKRTAAERRADRKANKLKEQQSQEKVVKKEVKNKKKKRKKD